METQQAGGVRWLPAQLKISAPLGGGEGGRERDLTDPGLGTQARGVRFCSVGNWGEDGEKMESLTEQEAPEF